VLLVGVFTRTGLRGTISPEMKLSKMEMKHAMMPKMMEEVRPVAEICV
jgi:hypothetical protein